MQLSSTPRRLQSVFYVLLVTGQNASWLNLDQAPE